MICLTEFALTVPVSFTCVVIVPLSELETATSGSERFMNVFEKRVKIRISTRKMMIRFLIQPRLFVSICISCFDEMFALAFDAAGVGNALDDVVLTV